MRRTLVLLVLVAVVALADADCGCGSKCSKYSDASKCTRCCTATVKRSLPSWMVPRPYRFLNDPPTSSDDDSPVAETKWQTLTRSQEWPSRPRRHRLLSEILAALEPL